MEEDKNNDTTPESAVTPEETQEAGTEVEKPSESTEDGTTPESVDEVAA